MLIKSVAWGKTDDPTGSITIGEFIQGSDYRTIRKSGTPNYLFILTVEGSGRVIGPDGQEWDTSPGDILLYDPEAFQYYGTSPVAGQWMLIWSHFIPHTDWNYWKNWEFLWSGLRTFQIGPVTIGRVRDTLHLVHETDIGSRQVAVSFMLNYLERAFLHISVAEHRATLPDRDARIQKALHFIEARIPEKLPIDRISRHCGLSMSRFSHLFRAETGRTPQQYIEQRRMQLAQNLLRYSNLPVGEVARACGFEDAFYFSSRFKGATGVSPKAYRTARVDSPRRSG